mmetsp:Transcript_14887/g.16837  ORF Transcript_14887/g.16837 Transcript_14887/m.16837 type:complete len:111 (+) Transcript_14887:152-484(+)|eukprot:CAMPEP_0184017364 /NCGR_PEP_ID=MMETSP0954-20121128/7493_1 /TAXON_ID=627963 /ORGANISM="Aplanochytrium sp, Strain PBS07" /LENGTH=110 /DNA_ID=CAMNT_0026298587 /DNA_START=153 /DNA_END=485 /DNA_ORIENTATION=-
MFASRILRSAVKSTTGIVGIPVSTEPRQHLISLYQKTLAAAKTLPPGTAYRRSLLQTTAFRLGVVVETEDIVSIEEKIGCGQVEELILQAEDELKIIPDYLENEVWNKSA